MSTLKLFYKNGMNTFRLVWFGQFISIMGSSMTRFALLIWAFEQTGKASTTALLGFFAYIPYVVFSPLAGVIIDRLNRKLILILSDLLSGLLTIIIMILFFTGNIEVWHLFLLEGFSSLFEAFQKPAYTASISLLVSKEKYGQVNGMRSLSEHGSTIAAPILASIVIGVIGIRGVMTVDIITFLFAIFTLLLVFIPSPTREKKEEHNNKKTSFIKEIQYGIRYLYQRKGLLNLMLIFVFINLLASITYFGILPAMILARSNNDELTLATVQAFLGFGGVIGSLIVMIFGIPNKKVFTILLSCLSSFMLGDIIIGLGNSIIVWSIGAFLSSLFLPVFFSADSALWQSKINPTVQGRIFSLKGMIQTSVMPIGFILGGYLADYVFEPMITRENSINKILWNIVGQYKGSGMSLMFIISGVLGAFICLLGLLNKRIINIEKDLPDFDEV